MRGKAHSLPKPQRKNTGSTIKWGFPTGALQAPSSKSLRVTCWATNIANMGETDASQSTLKQAHRGTLCKQCHSNITTEAASRAQSVRPCLLWQVYPHCGGVGGGGGVTEQTAQWGPINIRPSICRPSKRWQTAQWLISQPADLSHTMLLVLLSVVLSDGRTATRRSSSHQHPHNLHIKD